jgi:hypothetical protein
MAFFLTAAVVGAGASLIGGLMSSNATQQASNAQVAASEKATGIQKQVSDEQLALQKEMFNKEIELQEPFRQAGLKGQNRLMDLLGLSGNTGVSDYGIANRNFAPSDLTTDPGYQFRLNEGLKALDANAAARGGLISGAALKAATAYGQDMGSQEYQNAFNRYQTNRSNLLNPLQSLTGQAQTASGVMGNAAAGNAGMGSNTLANYGNNASNLAVGSGNAQASGYIGQANAWNNALSGVANAAGQYSTGMARYGGYGGGYGTNYPGQYAMSGMYGRSQ